VRPSKQTKFVRDRKHTVLLLRTVCVVALMVGPILGPAPAGSQSKRNAAALTDSAGDGYIGSSACAQCHAEIFKRYSQTSMGRSMSVITPELLQTIPVKASIYDEKIDRHFEVYASNGKLYQAEFQAKAGQNPTFRDTHELDWLLGSGMNGFGGIVQREGFLFQAPLSFYSKTKAWALSPGYEFGDYGFSRPILAGCIFCHSGRPRPITQSNGHFEDPPFAELAIGCENCHGPGALHRTSALAAAGHQPKGKDLQIVNPARLSPALANNICMSCHQAGDVRVLKPGKTFQDFRPGTPLDDTLSILIIPPTHESPPQADHLEHYYSMTLSKCYRLSQAAMSCITCHDPHVEPSREVAPHFFAEKCMKCHTDKSCRAASETRQHTDPPDNCIGCHMPKRDVQVIQHASITNHRILARPDEPFPDITFKETTSSLPDLIHLNPSPTSKNDPLPRLNLLQAYGELSETHPQYVSRYFVLLSDLESTEANNALVQSALGHRDLKNGRFAQAAQHLQLSVQIEPRQASVYGDLAEALAKLDRHDESLAALRTGIALDPFNPVLQKTLIVQLIQTKRYAEAKTALAHYLEVFPQDDFMRHMLERANNGSAK
jgi:Tetratricopeptide repeat